MFKIGDKVVIIDDFDFYHKYNIFKDKIYEIENVYYESNNISFIVFKNLDNIHINQINYHKFINLKEYRKQKLKNICSK